VPDAGEVRVPGERERHQDTNEHVGAARDEDADPPGNRHQEIEQTFLRAWPEIQLSEAGPRAESFTC
jgi:hypothetical protein